MGADRLLVNFSQKGGALRVVSVGVAQAESLAELVAVVPDLRKSEHLGQYCDAVNFLARGNQYRLIHHPDEYRAWYEQQFQAEDPHAPFQEGVSRLRDFGRCEMEEIQPPRVEGGLVIFYAEDDFLGIPYRVTAPAPDQPEGEITYEPLPMSPLPK